MIESPARRHNNLLVSIAGEFECPGAPVGEAKTCSAFIRNGECPRTVLLFSFCKTDLGNMVWAGRQGIQVLSSNGDELPPEVRLEFKIYQKANNVEERSSEWFPGCFRLPRIHCERIFMHAMSAGKRTQVKSHDYPPLGGRKVSKEC